MVRASTKAQPSARHHLLRLGFLGAHGESRLGGVEARRGVAQPEGGDLGRARAAHQLVADGADDRLAVLLRHRHMHGHAIVGARRVGVPARPHHGVAEAEQQRIAGVLDGARVIGVGGRRVHQPMRQELAPAIVHLVEELVIAARRVGRAQNEDIGVVLDHAAGIARRLVEIDDDAVARIGGIELALGRADDALVGAGRAERGAVGEGLDLVDGERGDARLGGRGEHN